MTRLVLALSAAFAVSSCGTAKGVFDGTGTVLEGVATDLRSAGNIFSW